MCLSNLWGRQMKDNLVAKSNDLIVASYSLTRNEQRLLLACISQIDSRPEAATVTVKDEFVVTTTQLKELYKDTSKNNAYRDLKIVSDTLFDREVTIALDDNQTLRTRFVSSVLFQPNDGQITITFAQKILPYLTQLKRNFTRYRLADTVELSSIYAIRLYELIVCWQGQNKWSETLELAEFRYMMGCEDKYKQFGQLRQSVIEKAIDQVNENTSYHVSVEYNKVRHTHRSVTFRFYKKGAIELTDEKGGLSSEKISRIVRSEQFIKDYNDHKRLSSQAKKDMQTFWDECEKLLAQHPQEFNKRPFDDYLK